MTERFVLNREWLASGRISPHLEDARRRGLFTPLSEEAREANRKRVLQDHPEGADLWVFGFGSLMWNPACHVEEMRPALVHGWHRRFNLWTPLGRGTERFPGVMLGLERGGACRGLALRIAADKIDEETRLIWRREMMAGAYIPTWVKADLGDEVVPAITFAINRSYERYAGRLPFAVTVHHLGRAEGPLGACIEYLEKTVAVLDSIGQTRSPMHDLLREARKVRERRPDEPDGRDDG